MSDDWFARANCRDMRTNDWFPERGQDVRAAKRVCASCEVKQECLNYAMEHVIKFGIWGGKSERERRALRRTWGKTTPVDPPTRTSA